MLPMLKLFILKPWTLPIWGQHCAWNRKHGWLCCDDITSV